MNVLNKIKSKKVIVSSQPKKQQQIIQINKKNDENYKNYQKNKIIQKNLIYQQIQIKQKKIAEEQKKIWIQEQLNQKQKQSFKTKLIQNQSINLNQKKSFASHLFQSQKKLKSNNNQLQNKKQNIEKKLEYKHSNIQKQQKIEDFGSMYITQRSKGYQSKFLQKNSQNSKSNSNTNLHSNNFTQDSKDFGISKNKAIFQTCLQKESSNGFTNIFKVNRESKNQGIYFQENRQVRISNFSKTRINSSQGSQFQFNSFLKASKQKEQFAKIRKQTTKTENNRQQIQGNLLNNPIYKDVICVYVKKGYSIGNIHVFQGQVQSLKLKYFQTQAFCDKNIQKVKGKISCNRNVIYYPQNVLKIYLKEIIFLSQTQATFSQKFILQIMQKNHLVKG